MIETTFIDYKIGLKPSDLTLQTFFSDISNKVFDT